MGLGVKIGLLGGTNIGKQVIGVNLLVEDKNIYIYLYIYTHVTCPSLLAMSLSVF